MTAASPVWTVHSFLAVNRLPPDFRRELERVCERRLRRPLPGVVPEAAKIQYLPAFPVETPRGRVIDPKEELSRRRKRKMMAAFLAISCLVQAVILVMACVRIPGSVE